jgi:hypothetical protein
VYRILVPPSFTPFPPAIPQSINDFISTEDQQDSIHEVTRAGIILSLHFAWFSSGLLLVGVCILDYVALSDMMIAE